MENVHGVDVSWMTGHNSNKDYSPKPQTPAAPALSHDNESKLAQKVNSQHSEHPLSSPKLISQHRPVFSRSASSERTVTLNGGAKALSTSPGTRRNSWLSNISSKFSSSPTTHNTPIAEATSASPPAPVASSPPQEPLAPPGPYAPKNAVLQPAIKTTGNAPYTPAPPKSTQPNFLQSALRRFSSGGQLSHGHHGPQHGLCERRVLNVDHNRERCCISELDQSKLRRVAFCVDVEIASGPRYTDDAVDERHSEQRSKRKVSEKGEGDVLKHAQPASIEQHETEAAKAKGQKSSKDADDSAPKSIAVQEELPSGEKDSKKREKKKRSEEERKARKEKKRKIAEANGTVPVELVRNTSESSSGSSRTGIGTPKAQLSPTIDPVRIYRRCCQLRETPILKKVTEQLGAPTSGIETPGVVDKLDLTGYYLQLPDLVTLGDYLAVVPVKEIILESCGLTDEGVRVILAGLLATKCPNHTGSGTKKCKSGDLSQGGFVERVVFKNNTKIGRDGWRYVCLFINMCRSLKSMDLSEVPFPQPLPTPPPHKPGNHIHRTISAASNSDMQCILARALGERLAGRELELLNMATCGLTTEQLAALIDGAIKSGLRRLGIAGNNLAPDSIQHVARFLRDGKCEGLDLGGNDLKDQLGTIAGALDNDNDNELYALSLADCNLTPDSLWTLFPILCRLKNFRFIDLSQNHSLFESRPSALPLLRRYIPRMPMLKRIHLADVSMTPEQAISLAEILPESPNLAHLNVMDNSQLAALASAKDEASQEEACALYASLMAAVRVSKTIICIDIEVPSSDSSEVVKALAKQVVAYCLRNLERGPVAEISEAFTVMSEPHGDNSVDVPDVLVHLVGHGEESDENHEDGPAPDEDYVIGGSGVVKALSICLQNRGNGSRSPSVDRSSDRSDSSTGLGRPQTPVRSGKAKDMSKNLLASARKIRARLQPALVKESRAKDRSNYHRLLFLDKTLEGIINRFEAEYPETRIPSSTDSPPIDELTQEITLANVRLSPSHDRHESDTEHVAAEQPLSDDEDALHGTLPRHNSDVSLASRALDVEEGHMHRLGQQFRRDIVNSDIDIESHTAAAQEEQPRHLELLRAMVDGLGGEELRNKIHQLGYDAVINDLNDEAATLRQQLKGQDPEAWQTFVDSQKAAQRNSDIGSSPGSESAIE